MGYLWALLAFAFIGSYMVPVRFTTAKGFSFFHLMGWGLLPLIILRWSSVKLVWGHPWWFGAALFSGFLWGLGQITANLALEEISLAKAVVYFNFNTLLNILLGLVFFHEAAGLKSFIFLLVGAVLLMAGAFWVTKISAPLSKEGNLKKGIFFGLLTGFFWGVYFFSITWVRQKDPQPLIGPLDVLMVLALGGVITALLTPFFVKPQKINRRDLALGFSSAFLWILGMSGMLMAIQTLGLSRAVPIINSNALVYAAWSLFIFKEISFSEWPKVLGSALLALAGGILMALSG
jgi:glucose uptake protein GlcU